MKPGGRGFQAEGRARLWHQERKKLDLLEGCQKVSVAEDREEAEGRRRGQREGPYQAGPVSHRKELGFYSKCDGKTLENLKQGSDMIWSLCRE